MPKKEVTIKHLVLLSSFLLIAWGFYRFLFKLTEEIEEVFIKPLLWLGPVFYFLRKEKRGLKTLGYTLTNIFPAIYIALFLGIFFALEGLLVNFVKYDGIHFAANLGENTFLSSLALSFITAISEETTFRGYFFTRVSRVTKNEWTANLFTTLVWVLIHIPISIFWWGLDVRGIIGYLALTTMYGFGAAFVFAKTKNIAAPILLHVFWGWPIMLFR